MEMNEYKEWLKGLEESRNELIEAGIPEYLKHFHYVGSIILNHMIQEKDITIDIGRDYAYVIDVSDYIELNSYSDDRVFVNEETEDVRTYEDLLELLKVVGSVNKVDWRMVYEINVKPFEYPKEWRENGFIN